MTKASRTTSSSSTTVRKSEGTLRFSLANWVLLAAGLLCVLVGYVLLGGGSTVAAPLLLILGYIVLIPLGIIR